MLKRYRRTTLALCVVVSIFLCTGCNSVGNTSDGTTTANLSMENTPIVDYEVPTLLPNILVDEHGYQAEGNKEVAVKGSSLPKRFQLVDANTKEVVLEGNIEDSEYNAELKLYTGYITFSEFKKQGTFYLECDNIGRSFTFDISSTRMSEQFQELYLEMLASCQANEISIEDAITMLTAYEWYPSVFMDADANQIPDIMEAMAVWMKAQMKQELSAESQALYTAALAKFSYLYQSYDLAFANECLQHASVVFESTQTTMTKDAQRFFALTELYRATGLYTYRNQISDYSTYFAQNSSYLEEKEYVYGAMTYMATWHKVDVNLCATFMENIMDRGEEIANRYKAMIHPITAKNNGPEDILKRAEELVCANYIMNNYEYNNILSEYMHYLMGANNTATCFYQLEENKATYFLLLAQLAAGQYE